MKKIIYKSTAVKAVIFIAAAILILSVVPLKLIKEKESFIVPAPSGAASQVIDGNNYIQQIFIANNDHLDTLRLYVLEGSYGGFFTVRLLDSNQKQLAIENIDIPEHLPSYVDIMMDVDLVTGDPYFFKVDIDTTVDEYKDTAVYIGIEQWGGNPNVVAVAYYNDVPLEGMNYAADYVYLENLDVYHALLYIGAAILFLLVGFAITDAIFKDGKKHKANDTLTTVGDTFKTVMNPLTAIIVIVCLIAIFTGFVSTKRLDNGVALVGTVLFAVTVFYGINHNRDGMPDILTKEYLRTHFPDIIQSVAVALALQGCCEYVSALYDINHAVAERKEMFWFCFIIIAMFGAKEIFNLYNLIYVIIAGIAGVIYYKRSVVVGMTADDLFVLKMTAATAVLTGLILIRTVIALKDKRLGKPNPVYGFLLILYFAAIIIFRNTRMWTVVLAAAFTLLYINYGMWEKRAHFLTNVMRGIVLQFLALTVFVLLHRPYTTYRSARFTHFFHTATITATYMTVVCCCALVLLLSKVYRLRKEGRTGIELRYIWKELALFGMVSSYLIFTMARTAYAAMFVVGLCALVLMSYGKGKVRAKEILKNICYVICSIIVILPVTFELQRTVPVLASSPYTYDIENYRDDTLRGRKLSSQDAMRVGRFIDIFADKILGVPEGTFDIYGEIEEFKRTHPDGVHYTPPEEKDSSAAHETVLLVSSDAFYGKTAAARNAIKASDDAEISYEDVYGEAEPDSDYTNGRLDIYRSYLEQLNMTGHDIMGAVLKNGEIATHAHDVYLQAAFDHGIPVGILFIIFGAGTLVMSFRYFIYKKDEDKYAALPLVVTLAFGVAGLVEWVYHLGHPMSFVLFLSIAPLVFDDGRRKESKKSV